MSAQPLKAVNIHILCAYLKTCFLEHVFKEQLIIAYRRNKNLRDMMGRTTLKNNKAVRKQKPLSKR